jgi:hypothetical protein
MQYLLHALRRAAGLLLRLLLPMLLGSPKLLVAKRRSSWPVRFAVRVVKPRLPMPKRPPPRPISPNRSSLWLNWNEKGSSGEIPLGPFLRLRCLNNLSVSVASEHILELPMPDQDQNLSEAEQAENKRNLIAELEEAARRIRSVSEAEARALKQKMWREQVERDGTEFEWGIVE